MSAVLLAIGLLSVGCRSTEEMFYERLVRSEMVGSEGAPEWVRGNIQTDGGQLAFVGRGTASNVLDEHEAFDEALAHAREQLANYVGTRVRAEICDMDSSNGLRYLPVTGWFQGSSEKADQWLKSYTRQLADNLVGELLPVEQHWEQWEVEDLKGMPNDQPRRATLRYKCWVLASSPRDRVARYIEASLKRIENDAEVARLNAEMAEKQAAADAELASLRLERTTMQEVVNAQHEEVMFLRERIQYGRSFRLTGTDNCPVEDPCIPLDRAQWRHASLTVSADVAPVVMKVVEKKEEPCFCPEPTGGK